MYREQGKLGQLWDRDDVQFIRLLAEIGSLGLNEQQTQALIKKMAIQPEQLKELFERAEKKLDAIKDKIVFTSMSPWDTCQCCNNWIEPHA